ncbi:hypothetical protein ACFX15_044464 [Malus domestica]
MQAMSVGVVCSFNSCRQGAFGAVLQFQLMQARSVGVVCSFNSCRQGAFGAVLQFQLVQARSVGVVCSFNSCRQGALGCRLLCSCRPGALVLPFMLVQTRSIVPCSLGSCRR